MELQRFIANVGELERRREGVARLAGRYGVERPEVLMMFTHPEMARLPIGERCRRVGITEEEFLYEVGCDGFRKFVDDMKRIGRDVLDLQSLARLSDLVSVDRVEGGEDYGIEMRALDKGVVGSAVQVNLSFFDRARMRLREGGDE